MKSPNYSPVYCALYPELTEIARKHGYALSVHGSLARDFDIVCIPWVESPSTPDTVVNEMATTFSFKVIGEPGKKPHGRIAYTLSIGFGECFLDLSFMPLIPLSS
jgi:hypothetical protein